MISDRNKRGLARLRELSEKAGELPRGMMAVGRDPNSLRPSKRAVMEALADILIEPNWEYREHGPDMLGWRHVIVEIDLPDGSKARMHVAENTSVHTLRKRMLMLCECFYGSRR